MAFTVAISDKFSQSRFYSTRLGKPLWRLATWLHGLLKGSEIWKGLSLNRADPVVFQTILWFEVAALSDFVNPRRSIYSYKEETREIAPQPQKLATGTHRV